MQNKCSPTLQLQTRPLLHQLSPFSVYIVPIVASKTGEMSKMVNTSNFQLLTCIYYKAFY